MAGSKDKRALVEKFFQEIEALEANPNLSPFSSVASERDARKVLKAVPNDWEPPFVERFYFECLKKGGIRAELKAVKPAHYDAMSRAFDRIAKVLGTEKAGLVHEVEMLILWEGRTPGAIERDRFLRNLAFVVAAERFTNIPNLAKKRASFEPFAEDAGLVELARIVLERVDDSDQNTGNELFCYWALVYLLMLDQSAESQAFLQRFVADQGAPGMRQRVFLVNRFLLANKKDPYFASLADQLRKSYPKDWLDVYAPR